MPAEESDVLRLNKTLTSSGRQRIKRENPAIAGFFLVSIEAVEGINDMVYFEFSFFIRQY